MLRNLLRLFALFVFSAFFIGCSMFDDDDYSDPSQPVSRQQQVEQLMSNSLHGTTNGLKYWYAKEQGGFEQFTHVPYDDPNMPCMSCHIEKNACTTCHETEDGTDTPTNDKCLSCHKQQKIEQQFHPDVHLMDKDSGGAGMNCADCHSAKQIHGDGTAYNSLHENPNKVTCQQSGCHAEITMEGNAMHQEHIDNLECAACHVKSTVTCYSCHIEDGSAFEPPITDWKILVKSKATGKVTTGNLQTMVSQGNTMLAIGPYFGHTIPKVSATRCFDCHGSDAFNEYNEKGTMTLTTWDEATHTLSNVKGVIPIPLDWETALRMPFIAKDASGQWTLQKESADAHQMLFAEPIDVGSMP